MQRAVSLAHQSSTGEDDYVQRDEFRALMANLLVYNRLYIMFKEMDSDGESTAVMYDLYAFH